tara:strand:+ start:336 stop:503 length:168 start_codon:yes stop_codon:yes gene_type:complete
MVAVSMLLLAAVYSLVLAQVILSQGQHRLASVLLVLALVLLALSPVPLLLGRRNK